MFVLVCTVIGVFAVIWLWVKARTIEKSAERMVKEQEMLAKSMQLSKQESTTVLATNVEFRDV